MAKNDGLVDMREKPKKGKKGEAMSIGSNEPGIHLNHEHLEKLGVKALPQVGDKVHIHAIAHVSSVGEHANMSEDGKKRRNRHVSLDIHHMRMGDEDSDKSKPIASKGEAERTEGGKKAIDAALSEMNQGAGSDDEGDGEND